MKRRDLLLGGGAAGLLAACTTSAPVEPPVAPAPTWNFAPVKTDRSRVIRSVVGLRPFRKPGFRLESQMLGDKTIVHNYGHGGGGVSLSWGCSEMAADLAKQAGRTSIAILGSGVMGLTTARVLQQAGAEVTIYAEAFPPDTTSNVAAAMWYPTTLFERASVPDTFWPVFHQCSRRSFRQFQSFANDPKYGVFWIRQHQLRTRPRRSQESMPGGDAVYPGLVRDGSGDGPFGFPHWEAYHTLMIDPDIYLRALVMDFLGAGGRMVECRFETPEDVLALQQRTIVNCTGLGAAALFGDDDLIPARGQLTLLLPQPEIDYGYSAYMGGILYMFPRKSAIVLGGSVGKGDWNMEVDQNEVDRMLTGHAALAKRA